MANYTMGPGPGRPKGLPNKATQKAREAIAMFVEGNVERLQEWLDKIASKDPEKAFSLFQSIIEFHVPKLQRTTVEGDADKPLQTKVTVEYVGANHLENASTSYYAADDLDKCDENCSLDSCNGMAKKL